MDKTQKVKIAELILDYDLYPRTSVDAQSIGYLVEAIVSGALLPAIIVCRTTMKVIDGFHRTKAFERLFGAEGEIDVLFKDYTDDRERFLDAMRYNSQHGVKLDRCDRVHCAIIGKRLRCPVNAIAEALHMQAKKFKELVQERTAYIGNAKQPVALKRTIDHMSGKKLTKGQEEANTRLSGMRQSFYVNQVILLIANGLIDKADEELIDRLRVLGDAIGGFLRMEVG